MSNRSRHALSAVAIGGAMCLAACGSTGSTAATSKPSANAVGTSIDQALPPTILRLPLTDSAGHTVHLADFTGRTIVLSDSMTLCQETCPLDTATLVQTARDEDRSSAAGKVVYLSVTVDPGRDTPTQLAAYQQLYKPVPTNWLTLTGSSSTINALWSFFGVWHQKSPEPAGQQPPRNWRTGVPLTYDVSHSDEVFFIDAHGHERFVLEGPPATASGLIPAKILAFMSKNGHQEVTSPPSTDWTEAQARQEIDALIH